MPDPKIFSPFYVGHLLTAEGVRLDPLKTEAVEKMPRPTDKQSVKHFLGFVREDLRKGVVTGIDLGDMDERTGLAASADTETSGGDALLTMSDAGSATTAAFSDNGIITGSSSNSI